MDALRQEAGSTGVDIEAEEEEILVPQEV